MKSLPFYIPEAWKRYPFRAEPPRIGHYREYPPSPVWRHTDEENSGSKSNGIFPEIRFENFSSPLEDVLFSGNLEIPEISCSIWHFYPVWIGPNSFSREKLQDGGESFESYNTGCKMICHSSSLFLIENENVRILFPGKLWTCRSECPVGQFARFAYSPARKARKFLS